LENKQPIKALIKQSFQWLRNRLELLFWIAALTSLYLMPADTTAGSLCPLSWLGFGHCPGCGIGHAIHDALHLEWKTSLQHHIMGIPAVLIIFSRIIRLLYPPKTVYETQPGQSGSRH
jgi:hypothetical protein